jgi:TPR repeat protein
MLNKNYLKMFLAGCLSAGCLTIFAASDDHQIGKFGSTVLENAAELEGDLEAWWDIGICYRDGLGVKKDMKKALYWLEKAANRNYDGACVSLGDMYYSGQGVKKDQKKAFELYNRGLRRQSPDAQYRIGLCLYNGHGTKKELTAAVEWFKKAAEQIEPNSQYMLGVCYEKGEGVKKDLKKAKEYYKKAAEAKHEKAIAALKRLK